MKKETLPKRILKKLKPIEKLNKALWLGLMRALLKNKPLEKKLKPAEVKRVILLRYDAIGDMITTLPMIRLLKTINPAMEVDVLASGKNEPVIRHDPHVNKIYLMPSGFWKKMALYLRLRQRDYDIVFVCIFEKASLIGILSNIIGTQRSVKATTWRGEKYWLFFNVQSQLAWSKMSMWDRVLYMVSETIEIPFDPQEIKPYLNLDENSHKAAGGALKKLDIDPGERFVLINLTTKQVHNRWTEEGYKTLTREILRREPGLKIVLLWMDEDEILAKDLAALSERVKIYPATRNLLEIAATVGHAYLLVSPDTSTVHMASALGIPVLGLYIKGNKSAQEWGPYRIPHFRTVQSEGYEWVNTIPEEAVISAFFELLTEVRSADNKKLQSGAKE